LSNQAARLTDYEKSQSGKPLVRWLHSFRYKNTLRVFDALSRDIVGRPIRVVDIGCAVAKVYALLDGRYDIDYTGIDISREFVEAARERYGSRPNFSIIEGSAADALDGMSGVDVVLALETLEHVPDDVAPRIIRRVAAVEPRLFVCSVPNELGPAIWFKNLGSLLIGHRRTARLSRRMLANTFWASVYRVDRLPAHRTGHSGFDWRNLAAAIEERMHIREIRTLPLSFLPKGLATNVYMIAEPLPSGSDRA
jgi:SAM-dependent methyltransferase